MQLIFVLALIDSEFVPYFCTNTERIGGSKKCLFLMYGIYFNS